MQSNPFCHYMFGITYINQSPTQLRDNSLKDLKSQSQFSIWYIKNLNYFVNITQGFLFTQISGHSLIKILKVLNISKLQDNFCIYWCEFYMLLVRLRSKCPVIKFGQQKPCHWHGLLEVLSQYSHEYWVIWCWVRVLMFPVVWVRVRVLKWSTGVLRVRVPSTQAPNPVMHMRRQPRPSSVQIMTCCVTGAKPLSELILESVFDF